MRIHVDFPQPQTIFFILIFLFILFATIKRSSGKLVFDIGITNEIKGFAIIAIIFAHIGYGLSDNGEFLFPLSILGGVGVNLFLFLSGFGLTVSAIKKPLSITQFYKNRLIKLFVPLWISLAVFLVLDKILLDRTYSLSMIVQSFLGYFPRADLFTSINSPLWFITLILFFYLLFPIIFQIKRPILSALILLFISYLLLFGNFFSGQNLSSALNIIDPGVFGLYKLHYAAFPLGIILADSIYLNSASQKIWTVINRHIPQNLLFYHGIRLISLAIALAISAYTAIHSGVGQGESKEHIISLITLSAIIFIFVFKKFQFRFFSIFGLYSYEIYLIHWPLMYRFDIFYKNFPPYLATSFYLLLFLLLGYLLNRGVNYKIKLWLF